MPISVPGPDSPTARLPPQQKVSLSAVQVVSQYGFSLLEVLIVLVIIGIATTAVSISAFSGANTRALRQDALRLTQLFPVAQAEARKAGRPIVWQYDANGYRFARAPRDLLVPAGMAKRGGVALAEGFESGNSLHPRSWTHAHSVQVRIDPPTANVFNTEWISGPLAVELYDGENTVRIVRSGNGQYQVLP